jgi:hypothetical protein
VGTINGTPSARMVKRSECIEGCSDSFVDLPFTCTTAEAPITRFGASGTLGGSGRLTVRACHVAFSFRRSASTRPVIENQDGVRSDRIAATATQQINDRCQPSGTAPHKSGHLSRRPPRGLRQCGSYGSLRGCAAPRPHQFDPGCIRAGAEPPAPPVLRG